MSGSIICEAKGHNGQLELTDTVVRIKRKGLLGLLTQGLKGDKEILISQISSVQFKEAGMFFNGYIQFAFLGGQEAKRGISQATSDENTVMFTVGQADAFSRFRQMLMDRMERSRQTPSSPRQESGVDDLERLAALRDRGVLTDEEFQAKKRQLLGL